MRVLVLNILLALTCVGFALAADPITFTTDATSTTMTNASTQAIRAFVVTGETKDTYARLRHDHFFKPDSAFLKPGQTTACDAMSNTQVRWVEYADGTTWGDATYGALLLRLRRDTLALYVRAAATTNDDDFKADIKDDPTHQFDDAAGRDHLQEMVSTEGVAAARQFLQNRIALANSRQ